MLNIVVSILDLEEMAVILERWDPAGARKCMPDGQDRPLPLLSLKARVGMSGCSQDSSWVQKILPLLSQQASSVEPGMEGRKYDVTC